MPQVSLLRSLSLPAVQRDVAARASGKSAEVIAASCEFGRLYFDGPRDYGYGGYRYDGRWRPVARDIVAHFGLLAGDRVLDVGCAKGFLVRDIIEIFPHIEVFGIDVSRYAVIEACETDVIGRLHLGSAVSLPFPDGAFHAAVAINSLHNLERADCVVALRELQRVSNGRAFVQVDAYRNEDEKSKFLSWALTAKTHGTPQDWVNIFAEAGFTGDFDWTIA